MKIMTISDIHLEFFERWGDDKAGLFYSMLKTNAEGVDVLVIAGDIHSETRRLAEALVKMGQIFPHVVAVLGNHDCYGKTIEIANARVQGLLDDPRSNIHILNDSSVTIDGQRFIGSTLWFSHSAEVDLNSWKLNDFTFIDKFDEEVYDAHERSKRYLLENVQKDDVVVTHHIPSYNCVADCYVGSPMNAFFVADVDEVVEENKPKIWIFGHTHTPFSSKMGETKFLCSPLGYFGIETGSNHVTDFRPTIFEV